MDQKKRSQRHRWPGALLWAIFGAGLLVQAFAPRLQIKNNAFVIPSSLTSSAKEIRPAEIIATERRMQLISAILTAGGALALAFYYRHALFRAGPPWRDVIRGGR